MFSILHLILTTDSTSLGPAFVVKVIAAAPLVGQKSGKRSVYAMLDDPMRQMQFLTRSPSGGHNADQYVYDTLDDPRHQMRISMLFPSGDHYADIHCHLETFDTRSSAMP
jgi:hypothetical protein